MQIFTILGIILFVVSAVSNYYQYKRLKNEKTFMSVRVKGWREDAIVISNCASTMINDIKNNPEMLAINIKSGLDCIGQSANSIQVNMTAELKRLGEKSDKKNNNSKN